MTATHLVLVSDIHFASPGERARRGYEARAIRSPWLRTMATVYRRYVWLRDPLAHNHQLDRFLEAAGEPDGVLALGDYSCDSAFVGVSDDAALASARECLDRLRRHFAVRVEALLGDHELGKFSLFGAKGGMRLESWRRATVDLRLAPFWRMDMGRHVLVGITSSLVALPVFEPETLPEEREVWRALREEHLGAIRDSLTRLEPGQRVVLFCHDPTALPFLAADPVLEKMAVPYELTVVGHLHSELILWESRLLSGMPAITFLGNTIRRFSRALRQARAWKAFNPRLCPSLTGIQLRKDGGFVRLELDPDSDQPPRFIRERLPWQT